jgi:Type II secretory pathway, component PulL
VAEKVFARQTTDGLWQWRLASVEGQWATDVYHSGDDEAMVATARTANAPVNLLVNGNQVVCCSTEIDAKEKRHMAKLLPYELEEQVIDNIEEMHLAFCSAEDDRINVAYISNKDMEKSLAPSLS